MKFKIYSPDGATSREAEFDIPAFEGDKGVQAVKEVVVAHQANARLGTHSTKRRGEVRGGGKKPWRQKGTGRARAGSTRSPLWPGGGVVFGPKPRDYTKKINAKVRALAFSRALFDRAVAGDIDRDRGLRGQPGQDQGHLPDPRPHRAQGQGAHRRRSLRARDPPGGAQPRTASPCRRPSSSTRSISAKYRKIVVSTKALEKIIARASAANGGN